jgi:hypothetical protein
LSYTQENTWGDDSQVPPQEQRQEFLTYRQVRLKKSEKNAKLAAYSLGEMAVVGKGGIPEGKFELPKQIVVLQINKTRRLSTAYVPGRNTVTLCRSRDRVFPIFDDANLTPKASDCASCPFGESAWANYDKSTGVGKPANPCDRGASITFVDFNNPTVIFTYYAEKSEVYAIENLQGVLRDKSKAYAEELGRRPNIFEFVVNIGAGQNRKGYWQPLFVTQDGLMAEDDVDLFYSLYQKHKESQEFFANQNAANQNAVDEAGQQYDAQQTQYTQDPTNNLHAPVRQQPAPQAPVQQRQAAPQQLPPAQVQQTPIRRAAVAQAAPVQQRQPAQQPVQTQAPVQPQAPVQNRFVPPPTRRVPGSRPVYQAPVAQQSQQSLSDGDYGDDEYQP